MAHPNTGWGESRNNYTVVPMENHTIMINNDKRINSVFHVVLTAIHLILPQLVF